ncbi:MAG: FdtA/QdtA family cupin domain-containing protein [Spirochaetales bacterium]|nr:FdtA/QdtA family cupin domain-containing protein [Spirochaetales bacterium]
MQQREFSLTELPLFRDERGSLSFAQTPDHVPFPIKRVFWLYEADGTTIRGQHAHRTLHQFLVAVSGSVSIDLSDGHKTAQFTLSQGHKGLYIPPLTWTSLSDFTTNVIIIAFASETYDASDYIHDYLEFQELSSSILSQD